MNSPNTRQVGGAHYGLSKTQHWDWAVLNFGPGYLAAAVTKYVVRWRSKDGVKDLEKAVHYLEKLIAVHREREPYPPVRTTRCIERLVAEYRLSPAEIRICDTMASYRSEEELLASKLDLDRMLADAR